MSGEEPSESLRGVVKIMLRWMLAFRWMLALAAMLLMVGSAREVVGHENAPTLEVLPWNSHKAAVSLTFDDGDPSQLDVAVPELDKYGFHGTFFLIANQLDRLDDWKKASAQGHEIGNHSLDHKHPQQLNGPEDEKAEVLGAKDVLAKSFGVPIRVFAYPYAQISPGLRNFVEEGHFIARGGRGPKHWLSPKYYQYFQRPDSQPDWMNIPGRAFLADIPFSTYQHWIEDNWEAGGWFVFVIHGLGDTGRQPIKRSTFTHILDELRQKDVWVATFGEVGAYWKAQKILEGARVTRSGSERKWTWETPANFPAEVRLKVRLVGDNALKGSGWILEQAGKDLKPDAEGIYTATFGEKELFLYPKKVARQ
jgi:peptidoglycan/xylan/chitin deacetylase (PgdA/CDA1 family)